MVGDGADGRLVRLAGQAAGLPFSCPTVLLISGEFAVNRTALVLAENGALYVLREYRWTYGASDDPDRPGKEEWLSGLARRFGVPAPRQLSRVVVGDVLVVFREFLPGGPLGDVPTRCASARRAAGTMMARIHAVEIDGDGSAGVIVGRSIRAFPERSWGRWQLANAVMQSGLVAERAVDEVDPDRVRRLNSTAVPLLDSRPVRLLHNDAHPRNILVDGSGDEWRCTGWQDWEFAWAGDPRWTSRDWTSSG